MISYDEIRRIFKQVILIFNNKEPLKEKLINFESITRQVVSFKSTENFELFVKLFDLAIDNSENSQQGYTTNDLIELYQKSISKRKKDVKNIYDYREYKETINLVLETHHFVEESLPRKTNDKTNFDIFLSHKYSNKYFNLIIYYILTHYYGLKVYVDWIYDRHINRRRLSFKTVELLQKRLNQSCNLLFFNLEQTNYK